jgi:Lon protease-like protein
MPSSAPLWLPLFPLQVVLLPGNDLPLHIFEDRYKEMIADVRRDRMEFGVVLASGAGIAGTGCTASIEHVLREYPDGRLDILTVGRRRFEISRVNEERPYLRCAAEFFDDDDEAPSPAEARQNVMESYNSVCELTGQAPLTPADLARTHASFLMARSVEDLDLRQSLLAARSETARLRTLAKYLPDHLRKLQRIAHAKQMAPRNGHGNLNGIH